ncbi:hypothetical protein HYV50_04615 [Candidatus Pacearchaeota archaeon]|nr:hypothetical protein [Candidatus Pacearchaeota archaeon]
MQFPSEIKFADEKVKKSFEELETEDPSLFKILTQALHNIKENAFCGIQVPKNLIPKEYIQKYDAGNLWKYDLPKGWRLLYTIRRDEIVVFSIVLEWLDHKNYERRFGY